MAEAFLLKGSPENLSWSLRDMRERRSDLLRGKPESWMVWGVNERFRWVLQQLEGSEVFIYVTRGAGIEGGLALYGVAQGVTELSGKYWPLGERWLAFYLEVRKAAPGVLEHSEDPKAWNLVPREKLAEAGVPVLPGPQKLKPEQAKKLRENLATTWYIDATIDIIKETTRNNYYNVKGVAELSRAFWEVVSLLNDVDDYEIDCYSSMDPHKVSALLVRSAFLFSIFHVIWPPPQAYSSTCLQETCRLASCSSGCSWKPPLKLSS